MAPKLQIPKTLPRTLGDPPARIADQEALDSARAKMETVIAAQDRLADEIKALGDRLLATVALTDKNGNVVWTEELCVYGGWVGFRTLVYLAERGDREAARWLAEKSLGAPEQPFRVRLEAESWSGDDALHEMYRILTQDRQLSDQMARAQIKLLTGETLPPLPGVVEVEDVEGAADE